MAVSTAAQATSYMELWRNVQTVLHRFLPKEEVQDWFDDVKIMERLGDSVILGVPSGFSREHIENNYQNLLESVFSDVCENPMNVEIQLANPNEIIDEISSSVVNKKESTLLSDPINENYTFNNFVIGASNKMASAAAEGVATSPAESYNPLFVYGGVGLGKTHLMQATGNAILKKFPNKSVAYLSAEQFVNIFIDAIKRNERLSFQATFRNVDVLLIDDIQFLAGKESTQEEFFHTFNALYNRKKQIVISSDRPPKDIPTIEDRLRSRFEWGLIVDIAPPDFEMRMAILQRKCEALKIEIPDEVLEYIASRVRSSIRELEGALSKISAYASISNEPITVEMAGKLLGEIFDRPVKELSIEKIQRKVAEYFNIKPSDIIGKNRSRSIARPRQVAMYLSRKLTNHSFPEIGTFFGNKDHTTVLFACNRIEKEMAKDPKIRVAIEKISDSFSRL